MLISGNGTFYQNSAGFWHINLSHNASTGTYAIQGTPTQITTGGIDGDSRVVWTD